jgi:hypothetical protein
MLAPTHESWEDNIIEEVQWVKINIDRDRSSYTEKDCFENLQVPPTVNKEVLSGSGRRTRQGSNGICTGGIFL